MNHSPRLVLLLVLTAVAASLAAGCAPSTEVVERDGRQFYRHNGLHFELLVPEGWQARTMPSDVAVEMTAPRSEPGAATAAVHVFSRRNAGSQSAAALAAETLKQMQNQMGVLPGEQIEEIALTDVSLAGLPAKRMSRNVRQGATRIQQELYFVQQGSQIWALIVSVPEEDAERLAAELKAVRESFRVW